MKIKLTYFTCIAAAFIFIHQVSIGQSKISFNRFPLKRDVYAELPLGSIKARGWLLKQLENQRSGATGHAEELYPGKDELGQESDWLGGSGSSWEKVPYYLKGIVALAYTLNDPELKLKTQKWMNYILDHQLENGFFGPATMKDWWPRMPFLYALQSYYEATNDLRALPFMSKYFRYELAHLDKDPLRDWGKARAGDNMEIALWLYNKTGESYLLDLVNQLKLQAYPWTDIYNKNEFFYFGKDFYPRHMVNIAEALKFPVLYSQLDSSSCYTDAIQHGIDFIMRDHGLPQGLGSGTEMLAGRSSTEGVETCTVVEWMQSLETDFRIQHRPSGGDELEKIAFNALPAQFSDDFKNHVYYSLPNEVQALKGPHHFTQDYANAIVPGPYSGYPCCRFNMHMGWPYFVKNSWAASPDGGLAVNTYGPMEVTTVVNQNTPVTILEETNYPFNEQIELKISLQGTAKFPLRIRIPKWCKTPMVAVNGQEIGKVIPGEFLLINRSWSNKDHIDINFPMEAVIRQEVNHAISIERGPLVFALNIQPVEKHRQAFAVKGFYEREIGSASNWNYGLITDSIHFQKDLRVIKSKMPENPFLQDSTPVRLMINAKRIPAWTMDYSGTAAFDVPYSPVPSTERTEVLTLVPFGSETLRISIFPTIGQPDTSSRNFAPEFNDNDRSSFVNYGSGWFFKDQAIHTALSPEGNMGDNKAIATNTNFSNFEYSANISIHSPGDAGLVFRVNKAAIGENAYQGYYLGLNPEKGMIEFGKANNGQWVLTAFVKYPLNYTSKYAVKIRAVNDQFEIFINGSQIPIINSMDKEFARGSIGLRAFNAAAEFDHIQVKAL